MRPADATETAEAWSVAIEHDGPTLFALSRQNLPHLDRSKAKNIDVAKGAYIFMEAEGGKPDVILIGTGSEVSLCTEAYKKLAELGVKARVVSMPSTYLFEKQDSAYRESILPKSIKKRVTVEAASTFGWHLFAGDEGVMVGIDHYGASAPGGEIMKNFGFTTERVAAEALRLLGRNDETKKLDSGSHTPNVQPTAPHEGHS